VSGWNFRASIDPAPPSSGLPEPQRGSPSAPAHTRKQKVKDLSTEQREEAVKPRATASPRGGVESSLRRAGRSATQVNPIRPDVSTSFLGTGEVERCFWHRPDTLTSRVNGWCHGNMGWLGAERHGTVIWWKQGDLPHRQQSTAEVRGSVVAQASRSYFTGGKTAAAERRRVTTAGAKGVRKADRP
jgi:hypothetical protein